MVVNNETASNARTPLRTLDGNALRQNNALQPQQHGKFTATKHVTTPFPIQLRRGGAPSRTAGTTTKVAEEPGGSLAPQVKTRGLATTSDRRPAPSSLQPCRKRKPLRDAATKVTGTSNLLHPVRAAADASKEKAVVTKIKPRKSVQQQAVVRTMAASLIPPAPTLVGKPKGAGTGVGRAGRITGLPTVSSSSKIRPGGPKVSEGKVALSDDHQVPACSMTPSDVLIENPRLLRTPLAFLEPDPNPPPVLQDPRVFRLAGERSVNIAIGRGQCLSGGIKRSVVETGQRTDEFAQMETPLAAQLAWEPEPEHLSSIIGPTPPEALTGSDTYEPGVSAATPFMSVCSATQDTASLIMSHSPSAVQQGTGGKRAGVGQLRERTLDACQFLPERCFVGAPLGAGQIISTPFVAGLSRTGPVLTPDSAMALLSGVHTPNVEATSLERVGSPSALTTGGGNPWEDVVDETPMIVGPMQSDITWWSPWSDSLPSPGTSSCRLLEMSPSASTVTVEDKIDALATGGLQGGAIPEQCPEAASLAAQLEAAPAPLPTTCDAPSIEITPEQVQGLARLSPTSENAAESVGSSTPGLFLPNQVSSSAPTPVLFVSALHAEGALGNSPMEDPVSCFSVVETPPTLMAGLAGGLDVEVSGCAVQASGGMSHGFALGPEMDVATTPQLFTGLLQNELDKLKSGQGLAPMSASNTLPALGEVPLDMGLGPQQGPPGVNMEPHLAEGLTPILTWNPAFLHGAQSPAESEGSGTTTLHPGLDAAGTPNLPRPRSAGACSSADRPPCQLREEACSVEGKRAKSAGPSRSLTPYQMMLAHLTGGTYASPDDAASRDKTLESPATPVMQCRPHMTPIDHGASVSKKTCGPFNLRAWTLSRAASQAAMSSGVHEMPCTPLQTPGTVGRGNLSSWLSRSGLLTGPLCTPARKDLMVLWEKARENASLHADLQGMKEAEAASAAAAEIDYLKKWDILMEHSRALEDENVTLRKELELVRTQLDCTGAERNLAVQAAVQQQQLAAEEAERAKVAATHLLDLADQAAMVSIMYEEEKDSLLRELDAAKCQLAEIQAACSDAKVVSATTEQQLHVLEQQLMDARDAHAQAMEACNAAQLAAQAAAVEKARLNHELLHAQKLLTGHHDGPDEEASVLYAQLQAAHDALYTTDPQQAKTKAALSSTSTEGDMTAVPEQEHSMPLQAAVNSEAAEREQDLEELLLRHQHEAEMAALALEHYKSENDALHKALQEAKAELDAATIHQLVSEIIIRVCKLHAEESGAPTVAVNADLPCSPLPCCTPCPTRPAPGRHAYSDNDLTDLSPIALALTEAAAIFHQHDSASHLSTVQASSEALVAVQALAPLTDEHTAGDVFPASGDIHRPSDALRTLLSVPAGGLEGRGKKINTATVRQPRQQAESSHSQLDPCAASGGDAMLRTPPGTTAVPSQVNVGHAAALLPPSIPFPGAAPSPGGMLTFFGTQRVIMRRHLASLPTSHPLPDSALYSGSTSGRSLTPVLGWQKVTSRLNLLRANLEDAKKQLHPAPSPGHGMTCSSWPAVPLPTPAKAVLCNEGLEGDPLGLNVVATPGRTQVPAAANLHNDGCVQSEHASSSAEAQLEVCSSSEDDSAVLPGEADSIAAICSPCHQQSSGSSTTPAIHTPRVARHDVSCCDMHGSTSRGGVVELLATMSICQVSGPELLGTPACSPTQAKRGIEDQSSVLVVKTQRKREEVSEAGSCPSPRSCELESSPKFVRRRKGERVAGTRKAADTDKEFRRRAAALNVRISPYFKRS